MSEIIPEIFTNSSEFNSGNRSGIHSDRPQNRSNSEDNSLNEAFGGIVTSFAVYKLLTEIIKPFTSMDVYSAGIIDANGNILKSENELTQQESRLMSPFTRLVIGIKRLVQALPGNRLKADFNYLSTAAKAMAFECYQMGGTPELFLEEIRKSIDVLLEEGEPVSGGSPIGNVIGGGFSNPQVGEPNNALAGYTPVMRMPAKNRRPQAISPIPGTSEPELDKPTFKKEKNL